MTLLDWIQTLNIRALAQRVQQLEEKMTATDDMVNRLRIATDLLAARIRKLTENDADTAAKFAPIVAELEGMGTDAANPFPVPTEADAEDGSTTA